MLLGCGMLSSSVAMVATYPLSLVRTRLQASGMPGVGSPEMNKDVLRIAKVKPVGRSTPILLNDIVF